MDDASFKSLENLTTLQNKFQTLASHALTNGNTGTGLSSTKRETAKCIEELSQQLLFLGTHTLDILSKQGNEVEVLDVQLASMHNVSVLPLLTYFKHMKAIQEEVSLQALSKERLKDHRPMKDAPGTRAVGLLTFSDNKPVFSSFNDLSNFTIHNEVTAANIANVQVSDIHQLMPCAPRPLKRGAKPQGNIINFFFSPSQDLPSFQFAPPPGDIPVPPPSGHPPGPPTGLPPGPPTGLPPGPPTGLPPGPPTGLPPGDLPPAPSSTFLPPSDLPPPLPGQTG